MLNIDQLSKHSDIVVGTAAGVLLGPIALAQLESMFDLGQYEGLIVRVGVAVGALYVFGKSKPQGAVAFATVMLASALATFLPAAGPQ